MATKLQIIIDKHEENTHFPQVIHRLGINYMEKPIEKPLISS